MKEEIKKEKELSRMLDRYEVRIPDKLREKPSPWLRFVNYICSPTKDPLEEVNETSFGFNFLRIAPLACGFVLAVIQAFMLVD